MEKIRSVAVYCGASDGAEPVYRQAAAELGTYLAENGIRLVYGGGRVGLMGIVADAAFRAGGEVFGVIPEFLESRERGNPNVTKLITVSSMHERKQRMFELSDGFAALPGGIGTVDETIEVMTWRQLGLHDRPIAILDIGGYWRPLRELLDSIVSRGFAKAAIRDLYVTVEKVEDLLPALAANAGPEMRARSDRL